MTCYARSHATIPTATVPATPTSTTDAARHAAQTTDANNLLLLIAR